MRGPGRPTSTCGGQELAAIRVHDDDQVHPRRTVPQSAFEMDSVRDLGIEVSDRRPRALEGVGGNQCDRQVRAHCVERAGERQHASYSHERTDRTAAGACMRNSS